MIHIYHHIWPGGTGLEIADHQKNRLFNNISEKFIYHPNIVDIDENECHTILKMLDEIKKFDNNDYILFMHTKGATKPNELYKKEWREYVELSLIDDYKSHIKILENGFDTSGVLLNYKNLTLDFMKYWGMGFYTGNFWWAKVKTFNKATVDIKKQWGNKITRYASECIFFNFIYKWNPGTLYPSFENFQIFYKYIIQENEINKNVFENRIKTFL
jgi:hypothetical protein